MTPKALFVDDSMTSQHLMERFTRNVCHLEFAPNAEDGLKLIEKNKFDLLLVDFLLPGENGLEMIARVRQISGYEIIPIILVSSALDMHLLSDALQAGANDCMQKPFKKDTTPAFVQKMLISPYFRQLDKKVTSFTCLKWVSNKRHFQYCPNFGFVAESQDSVETDTMMHAFLKEKVGENAERRGLFNVTLTNHLFEEKY